MKNDIPHGNSKYDWDKWLNGDRHSATQGVEFDAGMSIANFQKMLHSKAGRLGMSVESGCAKNSRTVVFRFFVKEEAK